MTPDEAVAIIHRRLGNRSGLETQILAELVEAQREEELEPELPWFLLSSTTLTTVADTETLALPSDFIQDVDGVEMWGTDSASETRHIKKNRYRLLKARYVGEANQFPKGYDLLGSTIYFQPIPDAAYSLTFFYFANDPTAIASGGATNLWLTNAPSVLIGRAGMAVAMFTEDQEKVAGFQAIYSEAKKSMMHRTIQRMEAGMLPNRVEGDV